MQKKIMDKVLDAFRNCISEPKCKDCPWEACEEFNNKKVSIPADLALAVDRMLVELLKTKDQIVDMETVDAIPVAWLKEYANKHLFNSAYSIVMGIINKRKWEEGAEGW